MVMSDAINAVYAERTRCVLALARAAQALGCLVGFGHDPAEPEWPVIYIELPTGQVSWHMRAEERAAAADIGAFEGHWDGHATDEKYARLDAWRPAEVSDG